MFVSLVLVAVLHFLGAPYWLSTNDPDAAFLSIELGLLWLFLAQSAKDRRLTRSWQMRVELLLQSIAGSRAGWPSPPGGRPTAAPSSPSPAGAPSGNFPP